MISVEEALSRILEGFSPLAAESVSVADALGRALAEDAVARVTQPPVDVSAMDGYAVRVADVGKVPAVLHRVGEAPAGGAYGGRLGPGEVVRIFTGAPLPAGADGIVIQEDTQAEGEAVTILAAPLAGRHIRKAGLDFREGEVGIRAPRRLTPRDIGLAAAMNLPWLKVRRRPRIAILATGDEVVMPGDPIGANQIVSSNALALAAAVTAWGGEPINLGIAADTRESLQALAAGARGADVLVTTGGASVGEHDLVQSALAERGLALDFWKIAMRPGKPLMFGRLGETALLGVPGNPGFLDDLRAFVLEARDGAHAGSSRRQPSDCDGTVGLRSREERPPAGLSSGPLGTRRRWQPRRHAIRDPGQLQSGPAAAGAMPRHPPASCASGQKGRFRAHFAFGRAERVDLMAPTARVAVATICEIDR